MRKNRKILRWGIFLLLCLLAATVPAALVYRSHTLPLSQCSELYRNYLGNPHIRAAFIKDFPINDTLSVDALTLQADSDSAWCELMADFGMSKILIARFKTHKELYVGENVNSIIMYYIDKNDIKKRMPNTDPNSRLVIGSHAERSICIFMTERKNTKEAIGLTKVKQLKDEKRN